MSTPNKIIIIVVIILIVVGAFWLVRRENQFQACLDKCDKGLSWDKMLCKAECREKYGKPADKEPIYNIPQSLQPSDFNTQEECERAGYYWYDEACHASLPVAGDIKDPYECFERGYYWYNYSCHEELELK